MTRELFRKRTVLLAPFGQHTRYLLRGYIVHAAMVMMALLCIALTVDMIPQLSKVVADASGASNLEMAARVGWFTLLRSADLMPQFIPLVSFLGVLWTEVAHTKSRERILIWNTGRTPFHCLVPVALLAIIFGTVQFAFDAYLRPAAMGVQIADRLGRHGEDFNRGLTKEPIWLSFGDDLVRARVAFAPTPIMYDLTLYRLTKDRQLREVDNARSAVPGHAKGIWILNQGSYWILPLAAPADAAAAPNSLPISERSAIAFEQREIALSADPIHLRISNIYSEYLPLGTHRALVQSATSDNPSTSSIAWLQFIYANALMPGAMALMAATLSLMLFTYQTPLSAQMATLPAGYAGHLAMKTFVLMALREYMNPAIAAWIAPIGLLIASGIVLTIIELRRRKGGRFNWAATRHIQRKQTAAKS